MDSENAPTPGSTPAPRPLVATAYALCTLVIVVFVDCHFRGDRLGLGLEDGPLEWGTVFFFVVCAGLAITARVVNRADLPGRERLLLIAFAVVLLLGVGEELSWGQRIFGWDPPEFMGEGATIMAGHDDTALHNLSFRSKYLKFSIGGLLFGVPMLIAVAMHGIWLPITYRKNERPARWLVEKLGLFRPPVALGVLVFATGTIIYIVRKAFDTEVEATEFAELVVPLVYAFILMCCYFSAGRRVDRVVTGLFFALVLGWLALTVGTIAMKTAGAA